MKKRMLIITAMSLTCLCMVHARLVKTWSHEELTAAADTIGVIEAIAVEKIELEPPFIANSGLKKEDYQAWLTTFKVLAGFKGALMKEAPLQVVHFTYSDRVNMVMNGAQFMKFVIGPDGYRANWLAYLKRRDDGRFEPATGHYDAVGSFKMLEDAKSAFR